MQTRFGVGIACALVAASTYGLILNLVRLGFENGVPGVEATLVRTTVIALVLSGIVIFSGQSFRLPRGAWPSFVLQSFATGFVSVSYLWSVE
jgi:uncharacterized membrane protein